MIFHDNRLLADDFHEISYLIFYKKLGKMLEILSSAAVVIGALRVNPYLSSGPLNRFSFDLSIIESNKFKQGRL